MADRDISGSRVIFAPQGLEHESIAFGSVVDKLAHPGPARLASDLSSGK
jgi:hypothetical protein